MMNLEVNEEALHESVLTLDAEGVTTLREWLEHCRERHDDLMFTPWGICEDDLSEYHFSPPPFILVEIWRIFPDSPEKDFLQGKPAEYLMELSRRSSDDTKGCRTLSLIATEATLRMMEEGLTTLRQAGDSLEWVFEDASASFSRGTGSATMVERELPLPPARMQVQRVEHPPQE